MKFLIFVIAILGGHHDNSHDDHFGGYGSTNHHPHRRHYHTHHHTHSHFVDPNPENRDNDSSSSSSSDTNFVPSPSSLSVLNAKTPLRRELEIADDLDKKTMNEMSRPVTEEMLHNPNVPIYEPYQLTEAQQQILLSHE